MDINQSVNDKGEMFFRKALYDNYGFWLTIAGINPRGPQSTKLLFISLLCCLGCAIITAYHQMSTDPNQLTETGYYMVYNIVISSYWLSFAFQQKTVFDAYRMVGEGLHDYKDSLDDATKAEVDDLLGASKKRTRALTRIITIGGFMTFVPSCVLRPIHKYFSTAYLNESPEEGYYRILPALVWLPMRTNIYTYILLGVMSEVAAMSGLGVVMSHNIFFLVCSEECATNCAVVELTLRHARRRAEALKLPFDQALRHCLAHSVRHHQSIIKLVKKVEKVVCYPSLCFIVCSEMLLCVGGFLIISDKIDVATKFSFGCLISTNLVELLVYCYYGEKVKQMSSDIFTSLYFGEWITDMKILKNYSLIIQARTIDGLKISAGGFMELNLETYSKVLSSAFSYFNILKAVSSV